MEISVRRHHFFLIYEWEKTSPLFTHLTCTSDYPQCTQTNLRSSTGSGRTRPSPFLPLVLVFHSLMTSTSSLSESSEPFFFPLPRFFFLWGRRNGCRRAGPLNKGHLHVIVQQGENGSGFMFLLFCLFILGGHTHGGLFFRLRSDELLHTVLVKETLKERWHTKVGLWYINDV